MFTPNGQQIVSIIFFDRAIRVWRADANGSLGAPLTAPAVDLPEYTGMAGLVPGGDGLQSSDDWVAIWNVENDHITRLDSSTLARNLANLTMTPDGRRAVAFTTVEYASATRTSRGKVYVFDLQTGRLISITDQTNVSIVAISPDGTRVATGASSADPSRPITVYDADTGKRIDAEFGGLKAIIDELRFSPDGRQLIAANSDEMRAWDAVTGKQIGDPWGGSNIHALAFSPDGRRLASGGLNTNSGVFQETISIWDVQTHQLVGEPLIGHSGSVRSVAFSSDGRLLVSGSGTWGNPAEIRIWDLANRQQLGEPMNFDLGNSNYNIAFSADGRTIFAGMRKSVWQWPGPPRWAELLCDKLSANMSRTQWKKWVSSDIEYVVGCPGLPVPE